MSALHEAARRVVSAWVSTRPAWIEQCNAAVMALDAALKAQPEPAQEPVATQHSEALRLADALDDFCSKDCCSQRPKAAAELRRLHRECEYLSIEREHARIMYEHSVKLLTGIHSLLYPPATGLPDGRTMVFRPKDPDPHEVLQELSDRIRALPDEIARAAIAKAEENT